MCSLTTSEDPGQGELAEAIREVVENIARVLSELLPAYEKLFGATAA